MSARFHIICFSPTGSTRKIAEAVAAGAGCRTVVKDVTLPTERSKAATLLQDDIVLLAAPVYYGRVERHAADFFGSLQGRGQSAVLLVNYGNRHFDDALLELHDLALNRGFAPIAAAAFVSEHSLSTADSPMAAGRPDTEDLGKARDFGAAVLAKLKSGASGLSIVPGNRPFKPYPDFHRAPVTSDNCTACGFCVSACPTGAIYIERDKALTREQDCIVCQACVKGCPEKARADISPGAKETREHLAPLVTGRKGVEIFL